MTTQQPTTTLASPTPVATVVHIVFDRMPRYARDRYALTLGKHYAAHLVVEDLRLYATRDDKGIEFKVSLFGRTYTNGGNWHLDPEPLTGKPYGADDD